MKQVIIYLVLIIISLFLIPILFTMQFENSVIVEANNKVLNSTISPSIEPYNYNEFATIKLLHEKTGEIEEIPIDQYLYGVVSAEMPAYYEMEALKSQAIVARTYTIYKIEHNGGKHEGAEICDNSSCCQAWITKEDRLARWEEDKQEEYWNRIEESVNSTAGKIITYEGKTINAFFHSNSGGNTEIPLNVWGGSGYPYLQVVATSGEEAYPQYNSEVELTKTELIKKLKETHKELEIDFSNENAIQILEYTDGGRIKTVRFGNVNLSGVEARTIFGLKSANFKVELIDEDKIKFTVIGYGHGVGMSQTGADALAKQGKTFEEIIKHFYVGVEIENM